MSNNWKVFNNGKSIGTTGVDGGIVFFDEEHAKGARITYRRGENMISVSMKIHGWIDHTRFFTTENDAQREYRAMKIIINELLEKINEPEMPKLKVWEIISDFVKRYP